VASGHPLSEAGVSDPAERSGAAKSKEEAEGQQACAATRNGAGGTAGEAQATEHRHLI